MNYNIKLDLQKLTGAFLANLKGKTETKKCLCIPVDEAGLFIGEKGTYLDLVAWAVKEPKEGRTHLLKQSISKEIWENLSEEAKKSQPILGDFKEMQAKGQDVKETIQASCTDDTDLPF